MSEQQVRNKRRRKRAGVTLFFMGALALAVVLAFIHLTVLNPNDVDWGPLLLLDGALSAALMLIGLELWVG